MSSPPVGIPDADWLLWPPEARAFILAQQQEIDQLRRQRTALVTELASLRERIGRSSRNSSMPPANDGPGLKPPNGARAVAASAADSRAIPARDLGCCRSLQHLRRGILAACQLNAVHTVMQLHGQRRQAVGRGAPWCRAPSRWRHSRRPLPPDR